jgi:hypothetical protein
LRQTAAATDEVVLLRRGGPSRSDHKQGGEEGGTHRLDVRLSPIPASHTCVWGPFVVPRRADRIRACGPALAPQDPLVVARTCTHMPSTRSTGGLRITWSPGFTPPRLDLAAEVAGYGDALEPHDAVLDDGHLDAAGGVEDDGLRRKGDAGRRPGNVH